MDNNLDVDDKVYIEIDAIIFHDIHKLTNSNSNIIITRSTWFGQILIDTDLNEFLDDL